MSPSMKTLARVPNAAAAWAAILTRAPVARAEDVPDRRYSVRGVAIEERRALRYSRVVAPHGRDAWADAHLAHPGFLHALAHPLGLALMAAPRFPLPALGLVHVKNSLLLHRPVCIGERVDIETCIGGLVRASRGSTCEVVSVLSRGGDIVATDVSTYLLRGSGNSAMRAKSLQTEAAPFASAASPSRWKLSAGVGREFARVSGDVHPIHVSALSARALGAPSPLAHGMVLGSRALSEAGVGAHSPLLWELEFPSLPPLPATVWVRYGREEPKEGTTGGSVAFSGFSLRGPTPADRTAHLTFSGRVTVLGGA